MICYEVSWVGRGGDGHFFDAASTECASKRATFGCFKPAEDHETRATVCNRLCSIVASATDLLSLLALASAPEPIALLATASLASFRVSRAAILFDVEHVHGLRPPLARTRTPKAQGRHPGFERRSHIV